MTEQLYFNTARARRTDVSTSHDAAARMNRSGATATHCAIVWSVLKRYPQSTYCELHAALSPEDQEIVKTPEALMRRLGDLEKQGMAMKFGRRKCRIRGTTMTTWTAMLGMKAR